MLLFSVFALEPRACQTETTDPICVYSGTVGQQSFVLFLIPFSFITADWPALLQSLSQFL